MTEDWNMRSLLTGAALGIVLGGAAVGVSAFAAPDEKPEDPRMVTYQQLDLFAEILARARQDYVIEIDEKAAMKAAINGIPTRPLSLFTATQRPSRSMIQRCGSGKDVSATR